MICYGMEDLNHAGHRKFSILVYFKVWLIYQMERNSSERVSCNAINCALTSICEFNTKELITHPVFSETNWYDKLLWKGPCCGRKIVLKVRPQEYITEVAEGGHKVLIAHNNDSFWVQKLTYFCQFLSAQKLRLCQGEQYQACGGPKIIIFLCVIGII